VHLGASREDVHAALGAPEHSFLKTQSSQHPTDVWHGNAFQVFYEGEKPVVAFIELSSNARIETILFGLSVFSMKAIAVIAESKCMLSSMKLMLNLVTPIYSPR